MDIIFLFFYTRDIIIIGGCMKKGVISMSVIYTFLVLFILTMTTILSSYIIRNNLIREVIIEAKEEIYSAE